jgi:hypothetical protein
MYRKIREFCRSLDSSLEIYLKTTKSADVDRIKSMPDAARLKTLLENLSQTH